MSADTKSNNGIVLKSTMKETFTTRKIVLTGLFSAIVCIATMFFKVEIPLGYAHLGNGFILLGCALMGNPYAVLIGGVGSALSDLFGGWVEWIVPTLIIKGLMGFAVGAIGHDSKILSVRSVLAAAAGTLVMIAGYFLGGSILYGSMATGAAGVPGYIAEGIIGMIIYFVLGAALEKAGIKKQL